MKVKSLLLLTRFELKHSLKPYMLLFILYAFFLYLLVPSIPDYLAEPVMGIDFNILFVLCFLPLIVKIKAFKAISIGNYLTIAPIYVICRQLAISKNTFLTYKLIYNLLESTILSSLFLIIFYPSLDDIIGPGNYVIFIFVWIMISFIIKLLNIVSDLGSNIIISIAISIIVVTIIAPIYLFVFFRVYTKGFFIWTLEMTANFPVYTLISTVIFTTAIIIIWYRLAKRKMNRLDIFV